MPTQSEAGPLPVSLAEIRSYLRMAEGEEEGLLASMARTAVDTCETFTGHAILERRFTQAVPCNGAWHRLDRAPVTAIETVAALGTDGGTTGLAVGDYEIDIDAAGEGWVRIAGSRVGARRALATYRAGLAASDDPNGVPEALRHGIVRLAAHLYLRRDETETPLPTAITALWRPWRRMRLG
jgi:uncharacterized phiE125 gp8 family phage protein